MTRLVLGLGLLLWGWAGVALAQTYEDADAAYEAKDYAKAIAILEPLAAQGNARAMNLIGYMYDFGQGYPKDTKAACDWYEKAAQQGDQRSRHNISLCYERGDGRPKSLEKAVSWLEIAARDGDLEAHVYLIFLLQGTDGERARYWGEKAIAMGSVFAKSVMETYGLSYRGPRMTQYEKLCVIVLIGILDKPSNACD